jgi:hypothetical protein
MRCLPRPTGSGPRRVYAPGERPGLRFNRCYHPVLQALARPGCTARAVRLPVAIAFQGALDLAVGTCLLGAVVVLYVLGFSHEASILTEKRMAIIGTSAMIFLIPLSAFLWRRTGQSMLVYLNL